MTDVEFRELRRFLKRRSGLDLGPDKRYLAESRLGPVCREAGLASLAELVRALRLRRDPALEQSVVDAMATNETMFFRDRATFEALRASVLPRLVAARSRTRRLRVWSAAASTGQEAYSVAMILADLRPSLADWRISILGTDVSTAAIERARDGCFTQFEVQRGLPIQTLLRCFTQSGSAWTISPELRRAVEFKAFNLLDDFDALGRFDLILCRNLLIYLDAPTKMQLLGKLEQALAPDGVLCLGASETALGMSDGLVPDAELRGFFVRCEAAAPPLRRLAG